MSNLKCSVDSCTSNKSGCCCRPEITVDGKNAKNCCETCCSNYRELPHGYSQPGATNNTGTGYDSPNKSLHVTCEAKNCTYNKNSLCAAKSISVKVGSDGTECATFKQK